MKKSAKFLITFLSISTLSINSIIHQIPGFSIAAASTQNNISGTISDGFSWSLDTTSKTLTIEGNGTLNVGANCEWSRYDDQIDTVVLGNGITDIMYNRLGLNIDTLILGDSFNTYHEAGYTPNTAFSVSSQNPYFTTYDGALYSKDRKTLVRVPAEQRQITIYPDVEVIADYSFWSSKADSVILPKGTKIVQPTAFSLMEGDGFIPVVLPDSIQSIELDKTVSSNNNVQFIFSNNNAAAKSEFSYQYGAHDLVKAWEKLYYRTVEEIYAGTNTITYGWKSICGNLFFVTKEGCAETGWIYDQGKYYFYNRSDMKILTSQTVEKAYFTTDGTHSSIFTLDSQGVLIGIPPTGMMATTIDSLDPTVISVTKPADTGLVTENENTYYYVNGIKQTGLQYIRDKAYIFNNSGIMQKSDWYQADGNWYYLNDYGASVVNCWRLKGGKYVYLGADGKMKTSCWVKDYDNWYYVKADGNRYESSWAKIGGVWYWFGGSGKMAESQWLKLDGKWYYFTGSGAMASNKWVKSGAYWYYLGSSGAMLTNTTTPDGYHVDSEGRWI